MNETTEMNLQRTLVFGLEWLRFYHPQSVMGFLKEHGNERLRASGAQLLQTLSGTPYGIGIITIFKEPITIQLATRETKDIANFTLYSINHDLTGMLSIDGPGYLRVEENGDIRKGHLQDEVLEKLLKEKGII